MQTILNERPSFVFLSRLYSQLCLSCGSHVSYCQSGSCMEFYVTRFWCHGSYKFMIFGICLELLFSSGVSVRARHQAPGKLTSCVDDFACLQFDHLKESSCYKEVPFKKFYLPVKTSHCTLLMKMIKLNLQTASQ